MFDCLKCHEKLSRVEISQGIYWSCLKCRSRFVGLGLLRKIIEERHLTALWMAATSLATHLSRPCPSCRKPMAKVYFNDQAGRMELDVCKICYMIWFDPEEFERLPAVDRMRPPSSSELPYEFRLQYARTLSGMIADAEKARSEAVGGSMQDVGAWSLIPAMLGLPVKASSELALRAFPWGTAALVGLNVLFSSSSFSHLGTASTDLGFLPSDAFRHHGLTLISYSFLHVNLLHLIVNMYFLALFGGNVEELLGTTRFMALYLAGSVAGAFGILALQPDTAVPTIGASAAVFAIVTCFAMAFPRARIGLGFMRRSYRPALLRIPAVGFLALLVIVQLIGLLLHLSGVSYSGHLGGIFAGFVYGWFRERRRPAEPLLVG